MMMTKDNGLASVSSLRDKSWSWYTGYVIMQGFNFANAPGFRKVGLDQDCVFNIFNNDLWIT